MGLDCLKFLLPIHETLILGDQMDEMANYVGDVEVDGTEVVMEKTT